MKTKLADIRILLLDVDGVLTDGSIVYTDSGEQIKQFNSKDGLGLRLLMDAGIQVGIVTGRTSNALLHRCRNLKLDLIFDGVQDKRTVIKDISDKTGIPPGNMAFAGDDLIDLPIMKRVGVSFCVADGTKEVQKEATFITRARGGHGAVREICEQILKAKGLWDKALNRFLS